MFTAFFISLALQFIAIPASSDAGGPSGAPVVTTAAAAPLTADAGGPSGK